MSEGEVWSRSLLWKIQPWGCLNLKKWEKCAWIWSLCDLSGLWSRRKEPRMHMKGEGGIGIQ